MAHFLVVALSIITLLGSTPVLAQNSSTTDAVPSLTDGQASSPLACFDYYRFGSVQADLQPALAQSVPGSTLTFTGDITNINKYPLLDGKLSVKIFKRDEASFSAIDGNLVVDQFVVAENITIPAEASKPASFTWKIPQNAEGGEYYAAYFFTTSDRYNLMGLSFTDDVVGNQAPFSITATTDQQPVTLSKIDTTLNGLDHKFVAFPLHFEQGESVTIRTTISNPSDTKKSVPLQWNQYAWDSQNEKNLRHTKTELVTLAAGETKEVSYEVQAQRESVVYVTAVTQDNEAKSILNIRYVRDGIEETRINFPSLTEFPLIKDKQQTLFACAHSTNLPVVPGNILTLTLSDKDGNTIHGYRYEGDITGVMAGFGDTFTPTRNYNQATLTATLERNGVIVEQVTMTYDCNTINPSSCLPEPVADVPSVLDVLQANMLYIILGFVIISLLSALLVFFFKKRKTPTDTGPRMTVPMSGLFFLLLLPSMFFVQPGEIEAKSVNEPLLALTNMNYGPGNPVKGCNFIDAPFYNGTLTSIIQAYNNSTGATIAENETVPAGTVVRFEYDATNNANINWFYAGVAFDSPNGYWVDEFPTDYAAYYFQPHICGTSIQVFVKRPSITYDHTGSSAAMSCNGNGSLCTVTSAGTLATSIPDPLVEMRLVQRKFNGTFVIHAIGRNLVFPTVWPVTYPIQVSGPTNVAPAAPTITGPTTGQINTTYAFNLTATDPDNDTIRYGIDWDNNSSVDEWVPGSGQVPSGTELSTNHSWSSVGSYTFKALTQDSNGSNSGWTNHTITINPAPAATANLTINGSDTALVVTKSTPLVIAWSSTNAPSCTLFGAGLPGGTVAVSGSVSIAATASDTYVLSCNGATDQIGVTVVNQAPNAPTITHPTGLVEFNALTTFTISATDPDSDNVFYEVDWNNDGITDATTLTVPSGNSQPANHSWSVSGLQTFQARAIDTAGAFSAWTGHAITVKAPPPPTVSLEIQVNSGSWNTTDQTINPGDSVTVRWSSSNASSCSGAGPGFNTGNSISGTDGVSTPAPNSSDTFTVSCSGSGGSSNDSITITVRQLPNFSQPNLRYATSSTFNPTTGAYDFVDWDFQTSNTGGSDTTTNANYEFQFDRNRDGYEVTEEDSLGQLPVSATANENGRVSGNIPFGNSRMRVLVDNDNDVAESDETDNERILDLMIPPPDPGLSITADKTQVRNGETTTIRWTTVATYPLNCVITGPSINVNPSSLSGSRLTAPLNAKSIFIFSCTEPTTGTVFSDSVAVETQGEIEET